MKKLSVSAIILAAFCCCAEVIDLTKETFWQPLDNVLFFENTITSNGRAFLKSKNVFDIDPAKKYTIKLSVTGKNVPAFVYVAFLPLGKYGEDLSTYTFQGHRNTLAQVLADAKKGDKKLLVNDGTNWKVRASSCVVKNAKRDNSDIPNKNYLTGELASAVKKGNVWELTFKTPLSSDVKKGTFIRQHINGGYIYFGGIKRLVPNKEVIMQGSITGRAAPGLLRNNQWPHNLPKARLALLLDWRNQNAAIEIKNATLTIE